MRSLPVFDDLRAFLGWAEAAGDLARLSAPVDLRHEMTAVQLASLRAGGPVLRFDAAAMDGRRAGMPVVANLFGTPARVAAGLGLAPGEVPGFGEFLAALRNPPPVEGMRDALSKGTADITQSPWESLYIFGADSLVHHHLDMPFYASINVFVMNKAKVEGLSPEDRKVIDDHCTPEWAEKMSSGWADVEAAGRDKIAADPEHHLYKPNAEQVKMWQDAAAPLTVEWKKTMADKGEDGDAIYNSLVEKLKKYNSLYGG